MFCTQCGHQLPDGARFCTNCGAAVDYEVQPREDEIAESAPETSALHVEAPVEDASATEVVETSPVDDAVATPVETVEPPVAPAAPEPPVSSAPVPPAPEPEIPPTFNAQTWQQVPAQPVVGVGEMPATPQPGPEPPRKRSHAPLIIGIVAAIAVVGAAGAFAVFGLGVLDAPQASPQQGSAQVSLVEPDPIAIPNVTGKTQDEAKAALEDAGLAVGEVTEEASSTVAEGSVISQNPAAGGEAEENSAVDLVVSTGPKTVIEHRYTLVRQAMTWSDARAYCEAHVGYLATVSSADEYNQVLAQLPAEGVAVCWIGGMRSGDSWEWVDGSPFEFNAWASGEPNNDQGIEDRLVMLKSGGSWGWYDVPNDLSNVYKADRMAFIMEQEVEVEVQ